jgi:serine protease Do
MRRVVTLYLVFLLGSIVGFGCWGSKSDGPEGSPRQGQILGKLGGSPAGKIPDFVTLAKRLQPVVVNISTSQATRGKELALPPEEEGDLMEQFSEKYFGPQQPSGSPRQRSLGSGFIIASDGSILTNSHVVENAEKIMVKLSDKREFEAKVLGKDAKTDIAVIKIEVKESLPTAQLGDSDRLEVGEWVMAIGNPFGLDNSVTSGIVSAKGRHIGAGPYDSFIQTDASINPGNSGGPLVNARGEVIGINMAIVSQTGGNIGIGFATPVNLVKELLPQLKSKGGVTRGWVGMAIQEVTPAIAKSLGLEKPRGALVAAVVKGGPAERGGIKLGDIITEYNGQEIKEANDFPLMVARTAVDQKVQMKILRERKEFPVTVTVGELREPQTPGKAG